MSKSLQVAAAVAPFDADAVAQLRAAVLVLGRRLRHQAPGQTSATELSVLARIKRDGPQTPGSLARSEHVQPPSMTRIIERLESAGYLERQPHSADRRQYLATITGKGDRHLAKTRELRSQWLTERLAQLDEGDRQSLVAALDALQHLAHTP